MIDEPDHHEYLRLLGEENDAFERAARISKSGGAAQREALAREWFEASARLLKESLRVWARSSGGDPNYPFPFTAIARLANLAESLSTGNLPDAIRDVNASGGRPARWPGQRGDIAIALQYIAYAKAGDVVDEQFIQTVSEAFGVDRTTVRDWQRSADELLQGAPATHPDEIQDALRRAGARFHFNRKGERTEGVE